jgi:hypothetical protein
LRQLQIGGAEFPPVPNAGPVARLRGRDVHAGAEALEGVPRQAQFGCDGCGGTGPDVGVQVIAFKGSHGPILAGQPAFENEP